MNAIPTVGKIKVPSFNPFQGMRAFLKNYQTDTSFEAKYLNRNELVIIKPFLDSLETPYLYIDHNLVIVECKDSELSDKINRLGFKSLNSVCPKTKGFKQVLTKCDGLFFDRVYHEEYKMEFFLIHSEDWKNINLTKSIVDDLKVSKAKYYDCFISIYRKLKSSC